MRQPRQQCVGLSVRAIVFLCNRIQKFLHFNPLFTWNKSFVLTNRNNPLANRLAFNGLNIFRRDKCAVTAFILFLISFIVSRQSVSSVKLYHISKHIAIMVDEIIIFRMNAQLTPQVAFKGDWGCFPNKQFAKISPLGESSLISEPVQVYTAFQFVTPTIYGQNYSQVGKKTDTSSPELGGSFKSDFCPIRAEVNSYLFPTWAQVIC